MASSCRARKLLPILSAAAALVAFLAAAAAALPVPPAEAEAYQEHHCGSLARLTRECRSFLFGGAAAPSPACCAAYAAAYAAKPLCLCYLDDATFWRAKGYSTANATGDSFRIPDICGQAEPWPIGFWCEEHELPPYGQAQGTPAKHPAAAAAPTTKAQPPATAAAPTTTEQPPSGKHPATAAAPMTTEQPPSGSSAAPPTSTTPPPATSKARGDSSPELISLLLVAVAVVCSII